MIPRVVGGALFCLACGAQAQDAIKCEDANGKIVYVDRPCGLYGLREIGPVKDRMTVAPPSVPASRGADTPATLPDPNAGAQPPAKSARELAREQALKRCNESRGVDCDSRSGLREYLREDRPITPEEQQAAGAARHLRELCAKDPTALACQDPDTQ